MKMFLAYIICIIVAFATPINSEERITSSNIAGIAQFPWMVAISVTRPNNSVFCGGALIDARFVLTAAQCVVGPVQRISLDFGGITLAPTEGGRITVSLLQPNNSVIIHPQYNTANFQNDIALIRLSTPVTPNPRIRTIGLPAPASPQLTQNVNVAISGWGRQSNVATGLSNNLRFANLTTTTDLACTTAFPTSNPQLAVCAAGHPVAATNICQGDFGGPLIRDLPQAPIVVGIASLVHQNTCGTVNPAVFTRTANMVAWIQTQIQHA